MLEKFNNKLVRSSMPAPFELFAGVRTFFVYLNGVLIKIVEEVNNR